MNVEVVIYPKRQVWYKDCDGNMIAPGQNLDPDRVIAQCYDDFDKWMQHVSLNIVTNGPGAYWLAIKADGCNGYTHYDIPKVPPMSNYVPLAEATWNVVDMHIAFELWKRPA